MEKFREEYIKLAKEYIDVHLNEDIFLSDVSDNIYISSYYLSRLFTDVLGISFAAYITERRIEKAKNMLSTTNLRLDYIAHECGFNTSAYFSYQFKKNCGMTPSQFKRIVISTK